MAAIDRPEASLAPELFYNEVKRALLSATIERVGRRADRLERVRVEHVGRDGRRVDRRGGLGPVRERDGDDRGRAERGRGARDERREARAGWSRVRELGGAQNARAVPSREDADAPTRARRREPRARDERERDDGDLDGRRTDLRHGRRVKEPRHGSAVWGWQAFFCTSGTSTRP